MGSLPKSKSTSSPSLSPSSPLSSSSSVLPSTAAIEVTRSRSAIQWKEHVEELVFHGHPNEHDQQSRWKRSCYPQMLLQQCVDSDPNDNNNYCSVGGTTLFTDILCDDEHPTVTTTTTTSPPTTTIAIQQQRHPPDSVEELKLRFQSMNCTVAEDHQFGHDFWDPFEDFLYSLGGGEGGCCNNYTYAIIK